MRCWWAVGAMALLSTLARAQGLDAGVEPPVLLQASAAEWPEDAGLGGDVELMLTIDETGLVVDGQVVSSPGEAFTAAALAASRGLKFAPASFDGGAVSVVLAYRYRFEREQSLDARARITGRVFTKGSRDVIALAHLTIEDGGLAAVETDKDGRFTLEVPSGATRVEVTAAGHLKRVYSETLDAGQQLEVIYRLEPVFIRPYETVVRGQTDRAEVSRVSLSGAELHEAAGTGGQPLRVVMLLPGVVTPASGLSYPVVRGSLPAATGYFLDGVRMPQLYHLMGAASVVHNDFIESVDFYPANAPTRHGRISGGVVSAQVARARDDRVHLNVAADLLQSNAFLEVPIAATGTNITVAGSVSYAGWLLGALSAADAFNGAKPVYESYDYQARVEQKLGKGNVRLLAFGSTDLAGIRGPQDQPPPTLLGTVRFHRVDLRLQYPMGPGVFEVGSNIGWDTIGVEVRAPFDQTGRFLLDRFIWTGRAQYRVELGQHVQLKAGFDFERQVSDVENTVGMVGAGGEELRQPRVMGVFTGSFVEAAFFSKQWSVVAGVRFDTWHLPPNFTLLSADPRLDLRFKPSDAVTLRASAGMMHQAPMLLVSLPVSEIGAIRSGLQEVGQFSVGAVGVLPWLGLEVSGDVFYNHIFQARERSLAEFASGISSLDDLYTGNRWGRAYGMELMIRLPQQGRVFGWLSYTLMRSERMRRFAQYEDQQVVTDTTAMLPFAFDQAHTLNLTLGYQLPKGYKLSASFHFNTGRPESGEFGTRTSRLVTDSMGNQGWAPVSLDRVDRLPAYARLDLRASKSITYSSATAEFYLDMFNTFFIPEVYGYSYRGAVTYPGAGTQPAQKEAISIPVVLPTFGVKVTY